MKILGKVFAILVLLLAVAVAVLSWMLAEQRKVFRAHSEALAQGLLRVATEVSRMDGVDVSSEMGQVTYTKAPAGGKESGTLGFEDFKKNNNSVSSSVDKLLTGIRKRQEQMAAFAATLEATGSVIGVEAAAGVNKEQLLADAEYANKLKTLEDRAKLVRARDEAVRKHLSSLADTFGANGVEVVAKRYAECAQDKAQKHGFSIGKLFREFENSIELLHSQQKLLVEAMLDFEKKVDAFDNWSFDGRSMREVAADFASTSKASDDEGKKAQEKFLQNVKTRLAAYGTDAQALNKFIGDKVKENKSLKDQTTEMRTTVETIQEQKDELSKKMVELQAVNKKMKEQNEWAMKNLDELKMAQHLNDDDLEEPAEKKVVMELKEVDPTLTCDVRHVEPKYNFVIISANNRQLCPGTKLIVLSGNGSETTLKANLEVKECTDILSKAFVTRGDINKLSVGDRVELSVNHETLVKKQEEAKVAAEEAKKRAEREAENERARKAIEARKEAERQNNLGGEEF